MNQRKDKKRKTVSFSLAEDTIARLNKYANRNHTNKSQAITNLVWGAYDPDDWPSHYQTDDEELLSANEAYIVEDKNKVTFVCGGEKIVFDSMEQFNKWYDS